MLYIYIIIKVEHSKFNYALKVILLLDSFVLSGSSNYAWNKLYM